jgi:glycosyltransferase involved in cell wall biosynthesis
LAARVPNKALITYDTHEPDRGNASRTPPDQLGFTATFNNLPEDQVVAKLNNSNVGLMLSEEEGACYANTEYLLCGLLVVSTPSRGGRDEFYDSFTAVICEPDQDAVHDAVELALARLKSGEITPEVIRTRTLDRIAAFRNTLAGSLCEKQQRFGLNIDFESHLRACLTGNNKMKSQRNFFVVDWTSS